MEIYVAKSGKETGPFTKEQISPMLESGMLTLTDSIWHKDLTGWIPVHQFLNVRPPIPATPSDSITARRWYDLILPNARSGDPAPAVLRLGAALIDFVAVFVALSLLEWLVRIVMLGGQEAPEDVVIDIWAAHAFVVCWMYYGIMEITTNQGTLGKMVCGLVVTDLEGNPIGLARSTGRYFGKFVSAFTFGVGFLMCTWTKRKQCLHDKMAGCVVVMK